MITVLKLFFLVVGFLVVMRLVLKAKPGLYRIRRRGK
jgi:hypothetical protein